MHEGINQKQAVIDPYKWVESMTESQDEDFRIAEMQFMRIMIMKFDALEKQILRENEHFEMIYQIQPLSIGDYIYYRRFDNPADNMTLYRFPIDQLQKYGFKHGETPYLRQFQ